MADKEQQNLTPVYQGRFAPSPTGFLHFGSLTAALGSYLDARAHRGKWLVRIEDIEASRIVPGGRDGILHTLEQLGLEWDGPVVVQSQRTDLYHWALANLQLNAHAYPCACSPEEIKVVCHTLSIDGVPLYPGICRSGTKGRAANVWRLRVPDQELSFVDRIHGMTKQNLGQQVGDFALMRYDGEFSYQLAAVVDDIEQGINAVVRGYDLFDSTLRQQWLYHCLGKIPPSYAHLPVIVDIQGRKLSKRSHARAINPAAGSRLLSQALRVLGYSVPEEFARLPIKEFLQWAIATWKIKQIPAIKAVFPGEDHFQTQN